MDIYPAIDLRDGKCVRLLQGDYARQIDYSDDPVAQAQCFKQAGARWLHIVDLDGALHGGHYNIKTLEQIRSATEMNIQIGGGIRTTASVKSLLQVSGASRVIIGTRAIEDLDWFKEMVYEYPHEIVLGLDAREGKIATRGWTVMSKTTVVEMAQTVNDWPLAAIVYTDIACDGMLAGPNIDTTKELAKTCKIPVIASGGVSTLADVEELAKLPITGIIIGRALYENNVELAEALAVVRNVT